MTWPAMFLRLSSRSLGPKSFQPCPCVVSSINVDFIVKCPSCNKALKLRDESLLGKAIRCPNCRKAIRIPANPGSTSPAPGAAAAKSNPEKTVPWDDEYEEEDVWNAMSAFKSTEEEDSDPDHGNEFDDDLNDFSDRSDEETFTDNYAAPTALPPRRSRKVAKSHPVQKPQRPGRPFPAGIVIAAIAVVCVLGLLVPFALTVMHIVAGVNVESQRDATRNSMKQLGLAFHNFHDKFNSFPVPAKTRAAPEWFDANGKPFLSWRVHILPFIDQAALYEQFQLNQPWDSEHNKPLLAKMPEIFRSVGLEVQSGYTCLQAPSGKGTIMEGGVACAMRDITDGTSNTVMLVQTEPSQAVPWTKPADYDVDPGEAATGLYFTNDLTLILTCDGAVHPVQRKAAEMYSSGGTKSSVLSLLFTKSDGMVIREFQ